MDFFLALGIVGILGFLLWQNFVSPGGNFSSEKIANLENEKGQLLEKCAKTESENAALQKQIGEISTRLENEQKEKNQLSGKGKQTFAENLELKNELKNSQEKITALQKQIADFESARSQKEKEFEKLTANLEHAREKLEKEQARVVAQEVEKQKLEKENFDRIWNDHENDVAEKVQTACKNPNLRFQLFDNKNLPPDFSGDLKPDFLVEFLDQFIIFDAKKSKDLKNYLQDQAKKTGEKCKGNTRIFNMIFFVVPTAEIAELKKTVFFENGFFFFAIAPESVEPVLFCFKKILEFENLENFDPQDRESILQAIANFEFFIRNQNAANILIAKKAAETLSQSHNNLQNETATEIITRMKNMRPLKLKDSDMKKLVASSEAQIQEVEKIKNPQTISAEDFSQAESLF